MIGRIIKLAIAAVFYIGYKIYVMPRVLLRKHIPPLLVILTYHPVKTLDAERFEKQMDMLLASGTPVALSDLDKLNDRSNIAVTFDDAYQSVQHNAVPILRRKNIPATIFVPSDYLGKKPEWIKNPNHPYADEMVMSGEQLQELPSDLITIGSHSASHIRLLNIDDTTAKKEILDSRTALKRTLNKDVIFFAAPYAEFDHRLTGLFKDAHYERVFLNIPTFPATLTDSFILGRTGVEPTDWPVEFRLKLAGAYQWLPIAIGLKKKILS